MNLQRTQQEKGRGRPAPCAMRDERGAVGRATLDDEWRDLLGELGRGAGGALVTVEVAGTDRGAVRRQPRRPLRWIEYRSDDDMLVVCAAGGGGAELRYFVVAPRRVEIDRRSDGTEIAVVDAAGTRTVITVHEEPTASVGNTDPDGDGPAGCIEARRP
jgi:Family of unknown function (DUF5335)